MGGAAVGDVHVLQMGLGWLSGPSVLGHFVTGSLSPHPHPAPLRPWEVREEQAAIVADFKIL